jgi:hypothetical protein
MINQTQHKPPKKLNMTIDGHKVMISFATVSNPQISQLVRNTLLDSYIRKNGICSDEPSEC